MMRSRSLRVVAAALVAAGLLISLLSTHSGAQSEYLGGVGMPYDAFERLPKSELQAGGGTIQVAFAPGRIALPQETVLAWVRQSAEAVSTYYGRFPIKLVKLLIVPVSGRGVQGGTTWGYRGGAIRITLGSDASEADLQRDWIMVHEMVHLALPDLRERHNWLSEGLAVYIEPIARVQAGQLAPEDVWRSMMRGMPNGMPGGGDRGLDHTPTWGRTYWGGAIFCMIADLEIRKRTDNRLGLQDAMRGVLAAGGNHEVRSWSLRKVLETADAAVGVDVLSRLYDEMGLKPMEPDLQGIWQKLGLSMRGGRVELDDAAPWASIRTSVTKTPTL